MIKPFKVALLLASILVCLGGVMLLFPKEGLKIGNQNFTFSTFKDFVPDIEYTVTSEYKSGETKDIQDINKTLGNINLKSVHDTNQIQLVNRIQHPSDFENSLFPFYQKLLKLKESKEPLRILHFGDSQIEGDRISGVLRDELQDIFGGCGVGFIPISENNFGRRTLRKKDMGWQRYQIFGGKPNTPGNEAGFMGYLHQFAPEQHLAKFSVSASNSTNTEFQNIKMLFRNAETPIDIVIKTDTGTITHTSFQPSADVLLEKWAVPGFKDKKFEFEIKGDQSPNFYGFAFDCDTGITVDNVPLRGSSGVEFTKIDKELLKKQLSKLNVGLIIYQFGVNVVPYVTNDYSYYERMVYRQLKLLKEIMPNTAILVVGVSDMCRKGDDEYESYPNIEAIRAAQISAATKTGCAFWDLFEVMGGKNSMVEWVNASPSLAEKDYTHFNHRGAKIVGKKLFQALLQDFNDYQSLAIQ
jgi:lysophospholipase L1-like esterase